MSGGTLNEALIRVVSWHNREVFTATEFQQVLTEMGWHLPVEEVRAILLGRGDIRKRPSMGLEKYEWAPPMMTGTSSMGPG